jgi:phage terminase Nu1 subunit (DNA packaging protein)
VQRPLPITCAEVQRAVTERYVTQRELAQLMGVSLRTVQTWTREGMPSESWGMRVRRYRASDAMAWARQRDILTTGNNDPARRLTNAVATHRKE